MELNGASAIVTGGTSGLGRATAELLASRGATVIAFDLAPTPPDLPDGITCVQGDVRDERAVTAAIGMAKAKGNLRVCVNCAGIGPSGRTVGSKGPFSLETFRTVIDVNLVGTFNVLRLAAAEMQTNAPSEDGRGVIVNTASVAAYEGQIGQAAYSASKGGIVSLTLTTARDLAVAQIRVVTIAPGIFDTPLLATVNEEIRASLGASVPHPARLGNPREYANLVGHIVDNPMLNGEVIRLDGAIRMAPR